MFCLRFSRYNMARYRNLVVFLVKILWFYIIHFMGYDRITGKNAENRKFWQSYPTLISPRALTRITWNIRFTPSCKAYSLLLNCRMRVEKNIVFFITALYMKGEGVINEEESLYSDNEN